MKILGISCSRRKLGNTDLLVHHALKGASFEGAEIRFLRLTDLDIRQCKGCFKCMAGATDCIQDDQLPELISNVRWADGVVMGAPTYILSAAGSVQNMTSRFFRFYFTREFESKLGLALNAAGGSDWDTLALAQGSLWFLFSGIQLIDRVVGYGQGPGEVFYDEKACLRALESGAAMARGETAFRGDSGACPECHLDLVITRPDGSACCILCDLPGQWVKKGEEHCFEPEPNIRGRFSPGMVLQRFEEGIFPSVARFQSRSKTIREKLKEFQESYSLKI